MQRDVYFSMFFGACAEMITVNMYHLNGHLTRERIYGDVIIGQQNRHLIMMTHMAMVSPTLPRLCQDILITNMETLRKIHQPHFIYQLLPLLCRNYDTLEGMLAICSSPNSPFTINDRHDPKVLTHRFAFKCARRREIAEFFKDVTPARDLNLPALTRKLPIRGLEFTGVMIKMARVRVSSTSIMSREIANFYKALTTTNNNNNNNNNNNDNNNNKVMFSANSEMREVSKLPTETINRTSYISAAALITTHDYANDRAIAYRALMKDYFYSNVYADVSKTLTCTLFAQIMRMEKHFHFMIAKKPVGGGDATLRRSLLRMAAEKKLYIYEKGADNQYHYAL